MKQLRIGVVGGYRGSSMINYCKRIDHATVVAICDKSREVLDAQREAAEGLDIAFYESFDEFITHDMDAVVLANYANEHAPFAIKAMKAGKHVFSEVLPVQTVKEAVELIEAVEETGMIYAYGENYCYMPAPYEMRKLYREGKIGEFEYGECEYIHNCRPIWHAITYGERDHWRNNMYSTFYCTHSIGPIIHMTGLRPVKVTGFEASLDGKKRDLGAKGATFGIEMITLENGGIIKSIHGNLYRNSVWYSAYGSKGSMECGRELPADGHVERLFVSYDKETDAYDTETRLDYRPVNTDHEIPVGFGHGGSDFWSMYYFVNRVLGDETADIIDVYEAMDMFLPGLFAYRSILADGKSMDIPNLRNKAERDLWRNDTACTDPSAAGDMLLPTRRGGTPEIDESVYDYVKELWAEEQRSTDENSYINRVRNLGSEKSKEK